MWHQMVGAFRNAIDAGAAAATATNWDPTSTTTTSDAFTLSGGNLIATVNANIGITSNNPCTRTAATIATSGAKKYWEVAWTVIACGDNSVGIGDSTPNMETYVVGGTTHSVGVDRDGNVQYNGGFNVIHAAVMVIGNGHTGCFALDTTLQRMWVNKDGDTANWNNSGGSEDPAAGTGGIDYSGTGLSGALYAMAGTGCILGSTYTANFGPSFAFTVPSGFSQI